MTENDIFNLIDSWDNFEFILLEMNTNTELLPALMKVAIYNEHPNSWRALYLADKLHDMHPEKVAIYIPEMIERLKVELHHGKKRHMLKLISMNKIADDQWGFLLDYCMNAFTSSKEPVANRVHAMQILYNISENEPAIKTEILELIQHEMELHPTPGIRSRGMKLAKKLQQQIFKK
jgi:hypothetical protein